MFYIKFLDLENKYYPNVYKVNDNVVEINGKSIINVSESEIAMLLEYVLEIGIIAFSVTMAFCVNCICTL